MAFQVLEGEGRTLWAAADSASTHYVGQLVTYIAAAKAQFNGAVKPLAVPAGAFDLTNYQVIAGIITAINDRNPQYDSTGQYRAGVATQAAQLAIESTGQEGMYAKGDTQKLVQITEILPATVIRGCVCNAALGTAPTLLTATTAMTDGAVTAITTNACDFTNVLNCGTIYCRTGVNAGLYRVSKDVSTTAASVTTAFPRNGAIGDTFVRVPFKQGHSTIYIAGPGLYVDCSKNPVIAGTDLFGVIVYSMNLSIAGSETVDFRFEADHFCTARA